jgi:hypothetical protein
MSNSGDERGYISDDQLPEDLQPEKNPLARDPDDPDDDPDRAEDPPQQPEGGPDLGDPGST